MKIGVVGAGFIGRALAQAAVRNGHAVMISNSREPSTLHSTAIALRCEAGTVTETAAFGEAVILAIPFKAYRELDPRDFDGKVVLDANNYYPERDGAVAALDRHDATTSGLLAQHLPDARVVKFLQRDAAGGHRKGCQATRRAWAPRASDRRRRCRRKAHCSGARRSIWLRSIRRRIIGR